MVVRLLGEFVGPTGRTLLHELALRGQQEPQAGVPVPKSLKAEKLARSLLEAGANPNARDNAQYTPLHLAAARGDDALVRILLAKGADVHARTEAGDTALYIAAYWGQVKAARVLMEAGADVAAANNEGKTALSIAVQEQRGPELIAVLRTTRRRKKRTWFILFKNKSS